MILAGRRINDAVGERVARECVRLLLEQGSSTRRVSILGVTFKEDVPDIRNSRVFDIVRELARFGVEVQLADPLARPEDVRAEHGLELVGVDVLALPTRWCSPCHTAPSPRGAGR